MVGKGDIVRVKRSGKTGRVEMVSAHQAFVTFNKGKSTLAYRFDELELVIEPSEPNSPSA